MNTKKFFRPSVYVVLLSFISFGVLFARLKPQEKNNSKSVAEGYFELFKKQMNTLSDMSYDYAYYLFDGKQAKDSIIGKLYKMGSRDYIDSNNYYSKVCFEDIYVHYNHVTQIAQYIGIQELENALGVSRNEMQNELFSIPDSSLTELGQLDIEKSGSNGQIKMTYTLRDTSSSISKIEFLADGTSGKIDEVSMYFQLDRYTYDEAVGHNSDHSSLVKQESVLKIRNIESFDVRKSKEMVSLLFTPKPEDKIVLSKKIRNYKLVKLL